MRGTSTPGRSKPFALSALATALVLAGAWLGTGMAPTEATFPGKNGRIAFHSSRVTSINPEGNFEIFTMNPDGTGQTNRTTNGAFDALPDWQPK